MKLTDLFETAGVLLVLAGLVVLVWPVTVAGALAAGGVGLIGASWLLVRIERGRAAS